MDNIKNEVDYSEYKTLIDKVEFYYNTRTFTKFPYENIVTIIDGFIKL